MQHVLRRVVAVLSVVALLAAPASAIASEPDDGDAMREFAATVDAYFDGVLGLLLFGITTPDTEPVADCAVPDGVVIERTDDVGSDDGGVTVVEGDWEIPESCNLVDVTGPNGQINHGQVVSSFVHALKALDLADIGVPFGQLVRQIAASDFGKADVDDDADHDGDDADHDGDDADDDGDDADHDGDGADGSHGPPPHANNDKDKAPKSNGSNNGNGRGPGK